MKSLRYLIFTVNLMAPMAFSQGTSLYSSAGNVLIEFGPAITDPTVAQYPSSRCGGACHFHGEKPSLETIQKWGGNFKSLFSCFDAAETPQQKINCMKTSDNSSGYANSKLGMARAGVGTKFFQDLFQNAYPDPEQFKSEYLKFVTSTQMPPFQYGANNPERDLEKVKFQPPFFGQDEIPGSVRSTQPLNEDFFGLVKNWVLSEGDFVGQPSMVFLENLMKRREVSEMPKSCDATVTNELKDHIKNMNSYGWTYKHLVERRTKMMGCENVPAVEVMMENDNFNPNTWAKNCLQSFPEVAIHDFSSQWAEKIIVNDQEKIASMRILEQLPFSTSYWMRSSADGRYVGNGMGYSGENDADGASGFIVDLSMKNEQGQSRVITHNGPYDPGFFADNLSFTWHMDDGAAFCKQSILGPENFINGNRYIDLTEHRECSIGEKVGTYQHPGTTAYSGEAGHQFRAKVDTQDEKKSPVVIGARATLFLVPNLLSF